MTLRACLRSFLLALALPCCLVAAGTSAQTATDPTRGKVPIPEKTTPPRLSNNVNDDQRLQRNYAQQPPVIPHRVDGYQVDKNFNKCMDCHARGKTDFSRAVPVSETHYRDRDGKELDHVSTRRYFCMQCHVSQEPVQPLVGNGFRGLEPDAAPGNRKP